MGTASSSCSPSRRWRRRRWGSGSSSAPARQSPEEAPERAGGSPAPVQALLPPPGEPDSDSELLDQALAECDPDWPVRLPRAPWQPSCAPAGGEERGQAPRDRQIVLTRATPALENSNFANKVYICYVGDTVLFVFGNILIGPVTSYLSAYLVLNFKSLPLKKADRKSKTSYDCSEEEMMAAIEQEYGR